MHVLYDASLPAVAARALLAAIPAAGVAWSAYRMHALSASGAWAAGFVGCAACAVGGVWLPAALMLFFVSGSAASVMKAPHAVEARAHAAKGACRDAAQVAANGGVALACAVVAVVQSHHDETMLRWVAAAVGALAAACGDTLSTEIGAAWGRDPKDVLTRRPVAPGTSGGVTPVGFMAACAGGVLVALSSVLIPGASVGRWLFAGACAGLGGSLADSVLGATVQGRWRCPVCRQIVETPHHTACSALCSRASGVTWLTNDGVNTLATVAGGAIGFFLATG